MVDEGRYQRVLNSLEIVNNDLNKLRLSLNYELKDIEYDIKKCSNNFINEYNDKLYLSMNKTCHSLQFTACHFIERGHYESAINNLWQSYIERKFKNIIYRYGSRFFRKSTENDSIENHEKHERLVLVMIKYLISYVKESDNKTNINNLNWVKTTALEILNKEHNGPGKFKSIKNKNKCTNYCQCCTNNNSYKTKLCKHYLEKGTCPFGNKCLYAHGNAELRKIDKEKNKSDFEYFKYFKEFVKFFNNDKNKIINVH